MPDDGELPEIIYFADPMCSWCWGFSPVVHRLRELLAEQAVLRLVMGGLRPGTTTILRDPLKADIRRHWEHVADRTGASFDFGFFDRDDFIYDTEPASRAVLTMAQCDSASLLRYFSRIQQAFYRDNLDVTDGQVLVALAAEQDVDATVFATLFASEALHAATRQSFILTRATGVSAFPTLLGSRGGELEELCSGYQSGRQLFPHVLDWVSVHHPRL